MAIGGNTTIGNRNLTVAADTRDFKVLHRNCGLFASVSPWPSSLAGLLISSEVEGDEEEKVRAQDNQARKGSKLLSGALARTRHPWPIR